MHSDLMTRSYRIGGIRILVEAPAGQFYASDGALEGYQYEGPDWDHRVSFCIREPFPSPEGVCIHHGDDRRVYRAGDQSVSYLGPVGREWDRAQVWVCCRERHTTLRFRHSPTGRIWSKQLLNAMDLPHLMTIHNGFLLHASFVAHNGAAILFTAPSGTGKSTQAQLWCDHMGAELINGDRAAVRSFEDGVRACGIPFSGSSPVRKNVTLPLAAIVYLSQAPENSITRLRGGRAFRRVWEGCTVNVWDRSDVELATKTVSDVISRIPVYQLQCTPDIRAVELLKNTMEVEA